MLLSIPASPAASTRRAIFVKLGNRHSQAISVVHLAIWLTFDEENIVDHGGPTFFVA